MRSTRHSPYHFPLAVLRVRESLSFPPLTQSPLVNPPHPHVTQAKLIAVYTPQTHQPWSSQHPKHALENFRIVHHLPLSCIRRLLSKLCPPAILLSPFARIRDVAAAFFPVFLPDGTVWFTHACHRFIHYVSS